MTDEELTTWSLLTDAPPPDELPPTEVQGAAAPRIFMLAERDARWPGYVPMPRLLGTAPARLKREWLAHLVAELTRTCPSCQAERSEGQPEIRHRMCPLSDFGKRVSGWLVPGSIAAMETLAALTGNLGEPA